MASRILRDDIDGFIFSTFVSSFPRYRPSVICNSEVIFGRLTFSQGFFVRGLEPGRGGGIFASDFADRFFKKPFFPPDVGPRESWELFCPRFCLY
jgi:hypothetical protein